jgi:hypothetical protein
LDSGGFKTLSREEVAFCVTGAADFRLVSNDVAVVDLVTIHHLNEFHGTSNEIIWFSSLSLAPKSQSPSYDSRLVRSFRTPKHLRSTGHPTAGILERRSNQAKMGDPGIEPGFVRNDVGNHNELY